MKSELKRKPLSKRKTETARNPQSGGGGGIVGECGRLSQSSWLLGEL